MSIETFWSREDRRFAITPKSSQEDKFVIAGPALVPELALHKQYISAGESRKTANVDA
ncbi:hypothetical protein P691DRAFT_809122 [Macrolepiota fuliginosa MF-IS2]|uniref:Uncharacterized protein n=1 Tax=Macrolepiota fuliginosa MF-IS2 TaxID=1400762 RepID=A0A9P5X3F0_9AGAR|nr:hypothetical protein P691DRAFT_809122 [Macrolepiota fuliginosa MF-IS2]